MPPQQAPEGQGPPQSVQLTSLPIQQLNQIRQQLERELEHFGQSAQLLTRTAQILQQTSKAIEGISESKEGQPLLLPLTQSLYVSGSLLSTETVMVDIGTGYYVEMTAEQAKEYCSRRINKINSNLADLQQIMRQKQGQSMTVNAVITEKMRGQQAQAAA